MSATIRRNVIFAMLGAMVLVLKPFYGGPGEEYVNAYAGGIAVSFALYFAALNAIEQRGLSRWWAAGIVFAIVTLFEATDGFGGLMSNVYDPLDFVANAVGIGLAMLADVISTPFLQDAE